MTWHAVSWRRSGPGRGSRIAHQEGNAQCSVGVEADMTNPVAGMPYVTSNSFGINE